MISGFVVDLCRAFRPLAGTDSKVGGSPLQHPIWTTLVRGSDWLQRNRYCL